MIMKEILSFVSIEGLRVMDYISSIKSTGEQLFLLGWSQGNPGTVLVAAPAAS